jgi:hypothetical protein
MKWGTAGAEFQQRKLWMLRKPCGEYLREVTFIQGEQAGTRVPDA